ncbi:TRAP transporter substrate-binding protein [Microbaculum marinum]|uniref:TRAP transporter substrate-binding protein n=1 Tax=Microbaculum marinum TaxID=1764581 RepID=A0AAW9RA68_9HYPH
MKLFQGLVAGTLALAAMSSAAAAAEYEFKIGHAASSRHAFNTGVEMFAEAVAEKTGGKVAVEVVGDRALGDDKQLLEGVQLGTIDGALVSAPTFPLAAGAAGFDALQLPFVVTSYDDMAAVLAGPVGQKLLDSLSEKGMKGLSFYEAGQRHFLSREKPVKSLADFEGLKTRIVPIPLHKATWEAVGTNPVGMPYGEVYSGLETGVIDAVEINLSSVESENLFQNAKEVTLTGHYFWPGVLVINKAKFDALPEDIQAAMIEAGRETIARQYEFVKTDEARVAEALKEKGVTINQLDDLKAMQDKTAPVVEEWSGKDPVIVEFIDAVRKGS